MKETGKILSTVDLTGHFFGCHMAIGRLPDNQGQIVLPVAIIIENKTFLPVFTTVEKLKSFFKESNINDYQIKKVLDGIEFLNSVKNGPSVILDPWTTPDGNTRFMLIKILE